MGGSERNAEAKQTLFDAIDQRHDELVETIASLVRIPSLLGDERPVQEWVAGHMEGSRLSPELWEIDDSVLTLPNAGNSGVPFAGRPNVTGRRPGKGGGRSLILNGHVDVVSPDPVDAWSYDPWAATIAGNRMFGRGANDMKSGVGMNLMLPRLLADSGIDLLGDLTVHSVIEEECTGNGSLAASLRDRADAALVTEPLGDTIVTGHLGVIWFRVHITGQSAHAGWAWQGVNAITKSIPVMQALQQLDADFNVDVHPLFAHLHHPVNLNIGVITGGDWPSTVPGACDLHCRVSLYPGTTVPELRATIEQAIAAAAAGDEWLAAHPPVLTWDGFQTEGVLLDQDSDFVRVLDAANQEVTGRPLGREVGTAVNDMRYYLFAGVPSTCFGADGGDSHAADEWLDLDSLQPAMKTMAAFIVDWCGVA
ncbi:MAG: ArgE/DapE family deacylase [Thermomicrobiales bacterium]|nr:ArgE/DapE family deacylase [Thermomicrobiales bacterium]